jgi:hypothetical protein
MLIKMTHRKAHLIARYSDQLIKALNPEHAHFLISASLMYLRDQPLTLLKAKGHKYIKRIPYTTSSGRKAYRYIYDVTHSHKGKSAFDASHLIEGTKFMLQTIAGAEAHGHITNVSGDKVTYVIDSGADKGKEITTTKKELLAQLNEKHDVVGKVKSKIKKLEADSAQARKTGTAKQIAKIEIEIGKLLVNLKQFEEEPEPKEPEPKEPEPKEPEPKEPEPKEPEPKESEPKESEKQISSIKKQLGKLLGGLKLFGSEPKPKEPNVYKGHADILENMTASLEDVDIDKLYKDKPKVGTAEHMLYRRHIELSANADKHVKAYNAGLQKAFEEINEKAGDLLSIQSEIKEKIALLSDRNLPKEAQGRIELSKKLKEIKNENDLPYGLTSYTFGALRKESPAGYEATLNALKEMGIKPPSASDLRMGVDSYLSGKLSSKSKKQVTELKSQLEEVNTQIESRFKEVMFDSSKQTSQQARPEYTAVSDKVDVSRHNNIVSQFTERMSKVYPDTKDNRVLLNYSDEHTRESSQQRGIEGVSQININRSTDDKTILHECAHSLEYGASKKDLAQAVTIALTKRTTPQKSSKLFTNSEEQAFDDDFTHPYAGKIYDISNTFRATELVSMGVEKFLPGKTADFLHSDPHHFAVSYAILKGLF